MSIYLLKKTHKITGLQYLCKTNRKNYKNYLGSGVYWRRHLVEHGKDHETELLRECIDNDEVRHWGLYYSDLWNVVNARDSDGRKTWANLKPEMGDGGSTIEIQNNPVTKNKKSVSSKKVQKEVQNRPEVKKKNSEGVQRAFSNPIMRQNHKDGCIKAQNTIERKNKRALQVGKNASRYDNTIYTFIHASGIFEICTRRDLLLKYNLRDSSLSSLISGDYKSTMGWSLLK